MHVAVDSVSLDRQQSRHLAADFYGGTAMMSAGQRELPSFLRASNRASTGKIYHLYRDQPTCRRSWSATVKSQAKYQKPPVIEVVSGLIFEPIPGLTIAHYGLFWQRILKEFPEAKHALPIGFENAGITDPFFVPRLWLINSSQDALIQLQANRFYFNWREGPNRSRYTSYTKIYEQFTRYWKLFVSFLDDVKLPPPQPLRCELTYINHIAQSAGWSSMEDVGKVIRPVTWTRDSSDRFLPTPKSVSWNVTFDLPDGKGILTAKMQPARRGVRDKQELILAFELAAVGPPADPSEPGLESWFETAHEWIVKGFEDMTAKDVQRAVWGKK